MRGRAPGWLVSGTIAVLIVAVLVLLVSFRGPPADPTASARQQYRSQSIFTRAGREFSTHTGVVMISLAADRPSASKLGLPPTGDTTTAYDEPITVVVSAGGDSIQLQLVQGVDVVTSGGRVSEVRFGTERAYDEQYEDASAIIAAAGTAADQAAFDAALQQSKAESDEKRYDAVAMLDGGGMSARVELSGSQNLAQLAIRVTPRS